MIKKDNDVALLLLEGFTEAWNEIEECLREVEETLQKDRVSRVAVNSDGKPHQIHIHETAN